MKCYSIKLTNRLEEKQVFQKYQPRCHLALLENDDGNRCLSSSEDQSDKHSYHGKAYLSVLNIMLPENAKAFNTGSSLNRWANKRPRLKSAKREVPTELEDVDNLDVSNIIEELQSKLEEETFIVREDIDPDIEKLLENTHAKEDLNISDNQKLELHEELVTKKNNKNKRKHKKKSKEKHKLKEKKSIKRNVSFSICKPPTPQTELVIRVEVVSNYSIELQELESHRSDYYKLSECEEVASAKFQMGKLTDQFYCKTDYNEKIDSQNLCVETKKAVLFRRCEK